MRSILIIFCCFSALKGVGQEGFSDHPIGLQWQMIKTTQANFIFPASIYATANHVANTIERIYADDSTLGTRNFKINIILQNQTTNSNGYVGIAPFLSEYYLSPPHDPYILGPIDWSEALAIHEYRHVKQAMNSRVGINKVLYTLFGEGAWGVSEGIVTPSWFSEGDAVYAETKYTHAGRGRLASFEMPFRSLDIDGIHWSYMKSRNGSFKSLVPNQYVYGYPMVKYVYDYYGDQAWRTIFKDAVKYNSSLLFSFKSSLKKYTGLTPSELYEIATKEFTSDPSEKYKDSLLIGNSKKNTVRNYKTPYRLNHGALLYLESSRDKIPTLQIYDHGVTKNLFSLGITNDVDYGFTEPLITWTETTIDTRWGNRDYSDIWTYDLQSNEKRRLSAKQKYFNPTPSNKGDLIACVEYLPSLKSNVIVLNIKGEIKHTIPMVEGQWPSFPTFLENDDEIVSVIRDHGYSDIVKYDLKNYNALPITTAIPAVITNIFVQKDTIYFSSDIGGIDNIYALDLGTQKAYQITNSSIGIQQFSIRNGELLYNLQTSGGIEIRTKQLTDCHFIPTDIFKINLSSPETRMIGLTSNLSSETKYPSLSSGLLKNPFHIYNWSLDPESNGNVFSIKGRNVLNTIQSSLSYEYLPSDKANAVGMGVAIGASYIVFTGTVSQTFGRSISKISNPLKDSIRWNETGLRLGAYIPWQIYHGNLISSIQPYFQFGIYMPDYKIGDRINYQNTKFIRSGIQLSNQRIRASQQVNSRWLQSVDLQWNQSINNKANNISILSEVHLPGVFRNDVVEMQADYNRQSLQDPYRFSNRSTFIRGYHSFSSDHSLWFRAAYHFPVVYPDMGINGLFFLKRLRSRLFFESAQYQISNNTRKFAIHYRTIGTELLFDLNLLNVAPVSFGVRYNHPLDLDKVINRQRNTFSFFIEQFF